MPKFITGEETEMISLGFRLIFVRFSFDSFSVGKKMVFLIFIVFLHQSAWSTEKNIHILRGTILNRTYGPYTNLYISLFLLTIFGPIYYGPP